MTCWQVQGLGKCPEDVSPRIRKRQGEPQRVRLAHGASHPGDIERKAGWYVRDRINAEVTSWIDGSEGPLPCAQSRCGRNRLEARRQVL